MAAVAKRHLLFGLLALQTGIINQEQLVAAFQAWTLDKSKSLADYLEERGDLDADARAAVDALAAQHLKRHGGDVQKSLAELPAGKSTRENLARIGDPAIEASLCHVGSDPGSTIEVNVDRTTSYAVGTTTSEGQRFRVLRPHARGGLGAVFVALDSELNREVALKQILDRHADDPTSRQRFLIEAEITGGLEHPGIVPVYGLGTYGDGRPYYAMRFIRGDSLKGAIDRFHADEALKKDLGRRSLELRKLLRRFTDVCNAIDYAHSRGVLHRDIKPGNIIVGKHGETLVVDWGLAEPLGRIDPELDGGERTLVPSSASGSAETLPGSALGTPAFMSPEQARGEIDRLGPRSDVFSLGSTLYCLLTGRPPFEGNDLGEMLRKVQGGEFARPRQLDPSLDKALEAVCLKAMALNSEDRYPSCRALADDVERWAADEPVTAWHEPVLLRARRWTRRHRTLVTSTAAVLGLGLAGLGGFATVMAGKNRELDAKNLQLLDKNRELDNRNHELDLQRQAAEEQRNRATKSEQAARDEEAKTKKSEAETKTVLEFLQTRVLAAARPKNQQGGLGIEATIRAAIDAAEPMIATEFASQPAVEGSIRATLGESYSYLGELQLAIRQLELAVPLLKLTRGPGHLETLQASNNLATAYADAGRVAEAIPMQAEILRQYSATLGPNHPDTLICRGNLGTFYRLAGRTADAVKMHEETLRLFLALRGPDHRDTLMSRNNLAMAYFAAGQVSDAIKMHKETLALFTAQSGADHPETLASRNNLALAYSAAGRAADAVKMHEGTLKLCISKLGANHPTTLVSRGNLAVAYLAAGRASEAITIQEEVLRLMTSKLGADHPNTLRTLSILAEAHESLGRWALAERLRSEALAGRRRTTSPGSPLLAADLDGLGFNRLNQSMWPEAESLLREALAIRQKKLPDDWPRYLTMSRLGGALLGELKYADSEPFIVGGYDGMKSRERRIPALLQPRLLEAAVRVVQLYEGWGKPAEAAAWKAKLGMPDLPAGVFAAP
jgi:serine/threonine protein kinase